MKAKNKTVSLKNETKSSKGKDDKRDKRNYEQQIEVDRRVKTKHCQWKNIKNRSERHIKRLNKQQHT